MHSQAPSPSRLQTAKLLLRCGIAFVFVYAAISSFVTPSAWLGFIPGFVPTALAKLSLEAFSVIQVALAAWLASGLYLRYAALASGLIITVLTLSNLASLVVTFRDIGLALAAFALAALA
jgi:hypothetical protein